MSLVLIASVCVGAVAAVCAAVLAIANRFISVKEDPRIGKVASILPGANCGGCGYAGCGDYARAIITSDAPLNKCPVGGPDVAQALAAFLGRDAGASGEKMVAYVACGGVAGSAARRALYNGINDCSAAAATGGGDKACRWGCLGYGSCARVCPAKAISLADGIAKVDAGRCVGCMACVEVCPRKVIRLVPASAKLHVRCSSHDKGPVVRQVCSVGCLGCGMCARLAPGAFKVEGFLSSRDYSAELPPDETASAKCPGHCIRYDER